MYQIRDTTAKPWLGALYGAMAGFFVATMAACVKSLANAYGPGDVLLFRVSWSAVILLPFVWSSLRDIFRRQALYVWTRSMFGALATLCYFYTLQNAPMSLSTLL